MLLSYITQLLYEYLLSTYLLCSRPSARLWSYVDEQNYVFSTVPCGVGWVLRLLDESEIN